MMTKVKAIWAWVCKNKVSLGKGLISLAIIMGLSLFEITILFSPGFTWLLVCVLIFISDRRDLKPQKTHPIKPNFMRKSWILACMILPLLYLQPWINKIVITNIGEYIATLLSILLLSFYLGFSSIRSALFKTADSSEKIFGELVIALFRTLLLECAVMIGTLLWMIFGNPLEDWGVILSVIFFAVIVSSAFTTYEWCLPIWRGSLMNCAMHNTCTLTSTILELVLVGISVYLIGYTLSATNSDFEIKIYFIAALLLSCLIPLKSSLVIQEIKERQIYSKTDIQDERCKV